MPTTVYQTIDVASRNHIIRNRDTLKEQFGITIFFPRNKVRGEFQDMALQGGTKAIFEAQKKISMILADWNEEYTAFKERKAHRKKHRVVPENHQPMVWPSISNVERKSTPKSSNPFDILGVDEEAVMEVIPVVKPKKATLFGWSKVVASSTSPSTYSDTGSWADMSDDEE